MRSDQIKAFVAVADCGSITSAARDIGIKRSTLSASLSVLEDELNVQLFQRSGNSIELTPIARAILPDCRRLLHNAELINQRCAQHMQGTETELRIARDDALPEAFWRSTMNRLKAEFPLTAVSVYLLPPQELAQFVQKQSVDLAFGLEYANAEQTLGETLAPVQMHLVAASNHPLSSMPNIEKSDLASYTQVTLTHMANDRIITDALYSTNYLGLTLFEVMRDAVKSGSGWAWLPEPLILSELQKGELSQLRYQEATLGFVYQSFQLGLPGPAATFLRNQVIHFLQHKANNP